MEDGYLIGGRKRYNGFGDIALITKTDLEGNIEWEHYADNFLDVEGEQARTKSYRLAKLSNEDIVGGHMVWYEYYGPPSIPKNSPLWYRSLHLN